MHLKILHHFLTVAIGNMSFNRLQDNYQKSVQERIRCGGSNFDKNFGGPHFAPFRVVE